jgi:hypothetical protein
MGGFVVPLEHSPSKLIQETSAQDLQPPAEYAILDTRGAEQPLTTNTGANTMNITATTLACPAAARAHYVEIRDNETGEVIGGYYTTQPAAQ